ncbi:beta-ketoacyl-ACP synthase [Parahaliea aestuarii]|uniref:Beta-ketoacyl-ACP synthase n=1 Tax=Parahaliea aestuarii TaxID=1852021 RepID=A0A5C8ZS97_9GAMM|nr:beta-ketoacyl-ACP synthase [Parahaliea aestuarii]TXS90452.1 beta-ketoacyl-ACP synthase [Parahaliea aestuarii]
MFYLNAFNLICNLGASPAELAARLLRRNSPLPDRETLFQRRYGALCGAVSVDLPRLPPGLERYDCRNNRLAAATLQALRPAIDEACSRYGSNRVGLVMATSTSGTDSTQAAIAESIGSGSATPDFHPAQGMLGGLGEFCAALLKTEGPVFTVSTACSSGGNALLAARRLLRLGLCDAVVCGGVDTLCELTVRGFASLEAVSAGLCRPFEAERDGINIGEAGAAFLLSRTPSALRFSGGAASSDAHHISAPHPQGSGAVAAIRGALDEAGLHPSDIDYLNLHGTGTPHNDAMEARALQRVFGEDGVACSTSKTWTGHTLGAAASLELALCCQLLLEEDPRLPPMQQGFNADPALSPLALCDHHERPRRPLKHCLSNAFAFGGNNVSLIVSRTDGR